MNDSITLTGTLIIHDQIQQILQLRWTLGMAMETETIYHQWTPQHHSSSSFPPSAVRNSKRHLRLSAVDEGHWNKAVSDLFLGLQTYWCWLSKWYSPNQTGHYYYYTSYPTYPSWLSFLTQYFTTFPIIHYIACMLEFRAWVWFKMYQNVRPRGHRCWQFLRW